MVQYRPRSCPLTHACPRPSPRASRSSASPGASPSASASKAARSPSHARRRRARRDGRPLRERRLVFGTLGALVEERFRRRAFSRFSRARFRAPSLQPERLAVQTHAHAPLVPARSAPCASRNASASSVSSRRTSAYATPFSKRRAVPREDGSAHAQALGEDRERARVCPRRAPQIHPVLDLLVLRRGRVRLVRHRRDGRAVQKHRVPVRAAPDDLQPEPRDERLALAEVGRLEGGVVPQEAGHCRPRARSGAGGPARSRRRDSRSTRGSSATGSRQRAVAEAARRRPHAAQRFGPRDVRGAERDAHAAPAGGQVAGVAHDQHGGPRGERERAALEVGDDDARRVVLEKRRETVIRPRVVLERDDVPRKPP